jgi:NADH-quinone oxidoreductase subunit K
MNEISLLHNTLILGAILFGVGMVGLLVRRNMIVMFLSAEMMLQGVSISLVAWGRFHNDFGGQMLTIFILTVAACEAGLGLALFVVLFHRSGSLDITYWQELREESQSPYVDRMVPEASDGERPVWPHLTPAGVEPAPDVEDEMYRSRV